MRYNAIIIAFAAAALLTACEDRISEREKLDSRTVDQLDVQYSVDGQAVTTLSYTHEYSRPVIDVVVNNDGLRWNLESDRDWCKVVPGEHRGSGPITLELEANESFDERETATLTFTAGDFRGFRIQVDQTAAAFIVSQPFFIAGKGSKAFAVNVTTQVGIEWSYSADDWLSVVRNPAAAPVDGTVTTTLQVTAGANGDDSRLGSVSLSAGAEKDAIYFWQFGTELDWYGNDIYLSSSIPASFSMLVPHNLVKQVNVPDYAVCNAEAAGDNLDKLTFTVEDFLYDASAMRDVLLSITLSNNTSTVVNLPGIKQDYKPAGALISAEGLKSFAQKVAAGEPLTEWETNGWVTVLQDIDMSGVDDWEGIGTAEHPFTGKFDGKGHAIKNLKNSSKAIFNNCAGSSESSTASIFNLVIDKSCNFYINGGSWTEPVGFGAVVAQATNTKIENCVNQADIEFDAAISDELPLYLGGILGLGKSGVSLRGCRASGCLVSVSATGTDAYVGGIAAEAQSINGCSMSGTLMHEGSFDNLYMGGITTLIKAGAVNGNSFSGTVRLAGTSQNNYIGGLYAATAANGTYTFDNASDMSTAAGSINLAGFRSSSDSRVFAGGFLGYAASGVKLSFKDYEVQTRTVIDNSVNTAVGYICVGGVLGGCSPDAKASSLSFEGVTTQGSVTVVFGPGDGSSSRTDRRLYGGVAGFVNGPATFSGCTNKGEVGVKAGDSTAETSSNNYNFDCIGGIAGYVVGGDASFTGCANTASVHGRYYVNNVGLSNTFAGTRGVQSIGGIVGAFNLYPSDNGKITVSDCQNSGWLNVYRGWAGGIAGFVRNGTVGQCTNRSSSSMDGAGFVQGGIVGCMVASSISNCTARVDITAGNGGNANEYGSNAGGIVGRVDGNGSKIGSCFYYGKVTPVAGTDTKPQNGGGIVGYAPSGTTITDCSYGGMVKGVTVTQAKLSDLAIGGGGATASNTILWDGN